MLRQLLPFLAILPAAGYVLGSLLCARAFFRPRRLPEHAPPVTILKPVKGLDGESRANFASFFDQDYPAPYQIVFAVADAADPALPVVREVIAAHPRVDAALVVDPTLHGPNYKVGNLINAFPAAKHDLLIVCDSDIRVTPDYLRAVAAPFADPQVGLVCSLYRSSAVPNTAAALEALGFTTEMVPNVLVALRLEGLSFALGASMAVRREALSAIGGFPALVEYLADDYQLGNKVHRAGWRLELSPCWVESVLKRETLSGILSRQLRWARTMRVSRPGGWFASVIVQPFPAALAALAAGGLRPRRLERRHRALPAPRRRRHRVQPPLRRRPAPPGDAVAAAAEGPPLLRHLATLLPRQPRPLAGAPVPAPARGQDPGSVKCEM